MTPILHAITPALAHVTCDANLLVRNVEAPAERAHLPERVHRRRHAPVSL